MKLKFVSIQSHGDYNKEFADLQATEDCDIGKYLLTDSTYTKENTVSNKLRHVYWFPDKQVKAGEYVRIFTRPGTSDTITSPNGSVIHKLYWGLKTAVWNDDGDSAILMEIAAWKHHPVK